LDHKRFDVTSILLVFASRKRRFLTVLTLCTTASLLIIGSCLLFYDPYRTRSVPIVQERFNAILQLLRHASSDTLLIDHEAHSVDTAHDALWMGCIRGNTQLTFGSERALSQVLQDYLKLPLDGGKWEQYRGDNVHRGKNIQVILHILPPDDREYPTQCKPFSLCYLVDLYYADPAIYGCSG
jgi:hypothetical protein